MPKETYPMIETTATPAEARAENIARIHREIANVKKQQQDALKEEVLDLKEQITRLKHPDMVVDTDPVYKNKTRRRV